MFKIKKTIFFGAVLLTILNNIISGQENMLSNGDFSNGMDNWDFYTGSSVASASVNSGTCLIDISFAGSNNYEPQITQDDFAIVAGAEYEARFDAKSVGSARDITFIIGTGPNDYIPFIEETVSLTTDMQTFTYTFTATSSDDNARIDFNCGLTTENVVIDNVFLTKIVPPKQTLVGDTLVLSCDEANGTLQWQESTDSINWNNITGATTNPHKLKITQSPTNKRYFRAKFTDALCPNIPVWYSDVIPTQILNNAQDLQPGDHYYGGIIFYTAGGSGLVAAEQDQGECMWGMEGMEVGGTTDSTGKQNTDTIVASTGDQNWPYAAKICDTLSLNGFTDWFLPAKNELDLLYQQKDVVRGFSANAYWSSTESQWGNGAWAQNFDESGDQLPLEKYDEYNVRAIRTYDTTNTINKIYAHTQVNGQPQTASVILQPQSQNICMNDEVSFSVTATGTSLTYQWYKNGAVIPDADSSSYTITDAELSDTGYYSCEITNLCRTIMSDSAELSECTQYKTAVAGDTLVLTTKNTYGNIQWQQSTDKSTWTDIPEATSPTYKGEVTGSPSGAQYYRIKLHDTTCPDATPWYNNELLQVNILDSITEIGSRYLGGIIYHIDENGTGLIAAENDQGMYNWSGLNHNIGTTDSTGKLNTEKIVAYHTMQSYQQPYAAGICDTLQLNGYNDWFLPAKNELDLLYQKHIFKNSVHEDYWTSTENVKAHEVRVWVQKFDESGDQLPLEKYDEYNVLAIRTFDTTTINKIYAHTRVNGQPQTASVILQPQSQNICMNDEVSFSVTATGTSLTYQWYKNGAVIPDADSSSYTITDAELSDTGYYSCEITNLCRTIMSDSAELSECTQYKTAVAGDTLVLTTKNTYGNIQWQQSTDKSTWTDIPEATSPTYKGEVTGSPSGAQYYRIKLHDTTCPDATPWYNNELLQVNILDSITEIGSRYLGGIIYHIDENGTGLIAAENDQGMYNWSGLNHNIGTTDSTGKLNTEKIVAYHTMQSYQQPYAAGICDTLQLNGYNDWFLPAKNELDLLYHQKHFLKYPMHEYYYTSTENNVEAREVWVQSFYTGEQGYTDKRNGEVYVQAIKEFQRHNYIYHTISVKEQPQTVSITTQPQSQNICMNDDVTFSVTATGTSPLTYQWYKNGAVIPDADSSSYTVTDAELSDTGYYSCEVTNLCRTVSSDSAELKVINLSIDAGDDKYICSGNSTPLPTTYSTNYSDESGNITYSWSPATGLSSTAIANPAADPATSTTYQVAITDEVGCQAFDEVFVFVQNAFADEICMITIDLETGKNMVVWEKTPDKGTKQYHVYKESNVSDVYNLMGTVPFDSNSVYVDLTSIPEQQQDLYKIAVEDTCGNISAKSFYHKPLFLQFANGQLEWQAYEIEDDSDIGFVSYIIYRGSDSTSLSPIDTVSASKTVYNDTSSVSQSNIFYYRVAGIKSAQCDPNGRLKASGGPYSQAISNLEDNRLKNNNITNLSDFDNSLRISPNPAHTEITILIPNISDESYELCISNTMGKTIFSRSNIQTNKITIPTKDIESGLYIVKIHGSKVYKGKLIVN